MASAASPAGPPLSSGKFYAIVNGSGAVVERFSSKGEAISAIAKYRTSACFSDGGVLLTPPGNGGPVIERLRFHYKHCNGHLDHGTDGRKARPCQSCPDCGLFAYEDEIAPIIGQLLNQ